MTFSATSEQSSIIDAPLGSQCVIACAGSGKTATAVRRLAKIRRLLGATPGHVALLSYSNTAVDTFRSEYFHLASTGGYHVDRVHISTVDSFIANQILLPHAARLMECQRRPFLVNGNEPFLAGHTVFNGDHAVPLSFLQLSITDTDTLLFTTKLGHGAATTIPSHTAIAAIRKLSRSGAYTHHIGRYWAWRVLREDGRLGDILSKRFPHVLIDEAQDIGSVHGAFLRTLRQRGTTVSLIGDPHQAIFDFADADGGFLKSFALEVKPSPLTINRRSVASIVSVANLICGTSATSARSAPERLHGAYWFPYNPKSVDTLRAELLSNLVARGYSADETVILCRGRALLDRLNGGGSKRGKGVTELFALASIVRDRGADAIEAFEFLVDGVNALLEETPKSWRVDLLDGSVASDIGAMRKLLWRFLRDPVRGLPASSLPAKTSWQPRLKARLPSLLTAVSDVSGYSVAPTWRNRITIAGLTDGPLLEVAPQASSASRIGLRTVHDVKGEGIAAVAYLAKKADLEGLLKGPITEGGRIGYVAITRARDLLLIGVPKGCDHLLQELAEKGLQPWNERATQHPHFASVQAQS